MIIRPTYKIENKLYRQGHQYIAGLDEAGRGAWAGPVVAAAVILPPKLKIKGLRDSKLLSSKKREDLYIFIKKNAAGIGIGIISPKTIDKHGILPATRQAFLKAIDSLKINPSHLLVDGVKLFNHSTPIQFYVKGDQKIMSIAAASIIAKVTRDQILEKYHQKFPNYDFHLHKGYGTKIHRQKIFDHGPCAIHRMSYQPLANF